jgi:cytochrome b involved in lipid metabolism
MHIIKKITFGVLMFVLGALSVIYIYGIYFDSTTQSISTSTKGSNQITNKDDNEIDEENVASNTNQTSASTSSTQSNNSKNKLNITEISKHSTPNDCYLIVKNKVYDVSSYINKHPGGQKNITNHCGGEETRLFSDIHSNFAWDLLKKYYIGDLVK